MLLSVDTRNYTSKLHDINLHCHSIKSAKVYKSIWALAVAPFPSETIHQF